MYRFLLPCREESSMSYHGSCISLDVSPKQSNVVKWKELPKDDQTTSSKIPGIRIYLSTCLCLSFFSLGLANSLLGPTFAHLTYLFDTDIKTLALAVTFGNIAYMAGALLCGIMFDRLNAEFQFAIATLITGISTMLNPAVADVHYYYVTFSLQHLAMGFIDAGGQSYMVGLWTGHRFKEPMLQTAHCVWSVGATLCPFIILPFLNELPEQSANTEANNVTSVITQASVEIDVSSVKFSYCIVGGLIVVLALCFCVGFFYQGPSLTRKTDTVSSEHQENEPNEQNTIQNNTLFYIVFLSLQFMFYFAYIWYEAIPGNFYSLFVMSGLDWDSHRGAILTSLYWGFHGVGRVVAIPVSMLLSPGTMLSWSLVCTSASFICMLLTHDMGEAFMWGTAAAAGFSMSSIFPTMILWTSNYMRVTGVVGAVFLIGGSLGGSLGGALAGYLLEEHSHLWMIYLSLIACGLEVIVYLVLLLLVKFCALKKLEGSVVEVVHGTEEMESLKGKSQD